MRERITLRHIQDVLDRINIWTDNPTEPYTKLPNGTHKRNAGVYVLSQCYGKVGLSQQSQDGGERQVIGLGTKRETYRQMCAFLAGIQASN